MLTGMVRRPRPGGATPPPHPRPRCRRNRARPGQQTDRSGTAPGSGGAQQRPVRRLAPLQIYAQLLDEGLYLCSVSTMYRVLGENRQVKSVAGWRGTQRRCARNWSRPRRSKCIRWDITKLAGPVKGTYFDAYVMIDIYSRYIVGVHVHTHESGLLAKELMEQIFKVHGVPQVVHADRGTSMTSKTVAALLADLEVTRSHSRPRVSNDNPYSEALFKTLKYGPRFPERFGSLCEARQFMDTFTNWYNHEHRHTGIGLHTPADVHFGLATDKAAGRRTVLTQARARHPTASTTRRRRSSTYPTPPGSTDQPRHHPGDRHDSRLTPTTATLCSSGRGSGTSTSSMMSTTCRVSAGSPSQRNGGEVLSPHSLPGAGLRHSAAVGEGRAGHGDGFRSGKAAAGQRAAMRASPNATEKLAQQRHHAPLPAPRMATVLERSRSPSSAGR